MGKAAHDRRALEGSVGLVLSWPDLFQPSTSLQRNVDALHIGVPKNAVLWTAMAGLDVVFGAED
jgi:hypothetical protein